MPQLTNANDVFIIIEKLLTLNNYSLNLLIIGYFFNIKKFLHSAMFQLIDKLSTLSWKATEKFHFFQLKIFNSPKIFSSLHKSFLVKQLKFFANIASLLFREQKLLI